MIRDVFYYGDKPNVHPRERYADSLTDARAKANTEHFWIINEYCDYKNFDWDFDFETLPDSDVWATEHNNVWPSIHQKDSGTWLCPKSNSELRVYRNDVEPLNFKEVNKDNWLELDLIDHSKFDFTWHPDPTDPPFIYRWGCKFYPAEIKHVLEYATPGATRVKYMKEIVELLPLTENWVEHQAIDRSKFDMSWRPTPLEPPFIYVWGNIYVEGTADHPTLEFVVEGAIRKKYMPEKLDVLPEWDKWLITDKIEMSSFDFSWRPDPKEPAFIYEFGTQHQKTGGPKYIVPGATQTKFIDTQIAKRLPNKENYVILEEIDVSKFDFSWHPDSTSEPYIYAWGNQWNTPEDKISVQYVVEGATEYKYMSERAIRKPCKDDWFIPDNLDTTNFDFSWEPSPADYKFQHIFGTQWQKTGGPRYVAPGAERPKYVDFQVAKTLPDMNSWVVPDNIDISAFDFSWHPDDTEDPYIYEFGTQWQKTGGPIYLVKDATEKKYIDTQIAKILPDMTNWNVPDNIDVTDFDFSWHPDSTTDPYIYEFGTQWQKTGGPRYTVEGSSEVKYIDSQTVKTLSNKHNFIILNDYKIKDFDYSWHPDITEEPYIYVFGNNQYPAEVMPTIQYVVDGATHIKYISDIIATLDVDMTNWYVPDNIDTAGFDFSWVPDPNESFIYVFGTQHQKTGGPKYIVLGAERLKYVDSQKVKILPDMTNWFIPDNIDATDFDYSWHPDDTEDSYIYEFGTQWQKTGGPRYIVPGATEYKYIDIQSAKILTDMTNWYIPDNIDTAGFDFSWHPDSTSEPYIYEFGTQWQKTNGPRYIMLGAERIKYVDIQSARILPDMSNWVVPDNIDASSFDFSWHPDSTTDPYIYEFGTQHQKTGGPKYIVPGAERPKYVDFQVAKILPDMSNWVVPENLDINSFDFSWHPDDTEDPYIYEFGTQWQKTGGPKYVVTGAAEYKYIDIQSARILPDMSNWDVQDSIDIDSFDFSWHPDSTSEPYIYQFGTQWQKTGGPRYILEGAERLKYVDVQYAKILPDPTNFVVVDGCKIKDFDYSWHPDNTDDPFIYVFGNNYYPGNIMPTIKYVIDGATHIKYIDSIVATLDVDMENWFIPDNVDVTDFDLGWKPNPKDPQYIYEFGTQWQKTGGPKYIVPGAERLKYIDIQSARILPDMSNWVVPENLDINSFDFSWHPDSTSDPYIYEFGTQWQKTGGPKYVVTGAAEYKYIDIQSARILPDMSNWVVPDNIDASSFDFSWHPDSTSSEPYIYQFGTQHQKTGGPRYITPNAVHYKYIDVQQARILPDMTNWFIPDNVDVTNFDFSWHPDSTSEPRVYQFGTLLDKEYGPRYITPDTTTQYITHLLRVEIKLNDTVVEKEITVNQYYIETTLEDLVNQHNDELFWALNSDIDYTDFDFSWRPNIDQTQYVHAFGTKDLIDTQTYFVNGLLYTKGYKDINYVEDVVVNVKPTLDMFFVDKGNIESVTRFNKLKEKFGARIQKTRYLNSWVDTINRCINRASTSLCWILNSELDYSNFEFDYYPNPWQMKMVHVFGTQYSHWGTTFMVNRETFTKDTKYIKIIEHLSNLNFIKDKRAKATDCVYDMLLIDHGNIELENVKKTLEEKSSGNTVTTIKYQDSYLTTIKSYIEKMTTKRDHYLWVCSSVCDYTDFDFSYICDPFARDNLHVFPTGKQKFGDTFLLDVNKTREIINDLEKLEDYSTVNYNGSINAKRYQEPIIVSNEDTHSIVPGMINGFPYATLITSDNIHLENIDIEPMNLWSKESKNIIIASTGASKIVVPAEVQDYVKTQLYDYPYIKRLPKIQKSQPHDIVFISNGEKCADSNYERLLSATKGLSNMIKRVDGINGRTEALHAAANSSTTPWFYGVTAKLYVNNKFDFNFQADRMQIPKHYIFNAYNPVNDLYYGHQSMVLYNKNLVINNPGVGLDFTLDSENVTIDLNCGTIVGDTDEYSTWRTAFREAVKLKYYSVFKPSDTEAQSRLAAWTTIGKGNFGEWSIKGALDGIEFYDEVNGELNKLRQSYYWDWLKVRFEGKYKL